MMDVVWVWCVWKSHLKGALDRSGPTELGKQAGVDVEGPKGGDVQEGLGQEVAIGSCHAQVRLEACQCLQEACLSSLPLSSLPCASSTVCSFLSH